MCQRLHTAHLTLHALGSASAGTGIRGLVLVLQVLLLGVQAVHSLWTLQLLVWLLNTLKENNRQLKRLTTIKKKKKKRKFLFSVRVPNWKYL